MKHATLPRHWSREQALAVADFLEAIIRAVWRQHGEQMAARIEYLRDPPRETAQPKSDQDCLPF